MKKVMFIMAAALLMMTQCKKENETPNDPAEGTMKMTVTAGPGRTGINTTDGSITWSAGDKLYVSDGTNWLGSLTLVGNGGSAQGTFTGNIVGIGESETTCHFFYLGHDNGMAELTGTAAANISFAAQDGTLAGAMKYHLGYGNTNVTVTDDEAIGSVIMNTKIAIAHLNLITAGSQAYTGSVTMEGTGICNVMTVNPNGTFSGSGTDGITIGATTTGEKYVTLIPTTGTDRVDVAFTGDATGSMTFLAGISENKFYGMKDAMTVTVTEPSYLPGEFSVSGTTKVKFSKGNLWADATDAENPVFHFEEHQWDFQLGVKNVDEWGSGKWEPSHVIHFYWRKNAKEAVAENYNWGWAPSDVFFTNDTETTANPDFQVAGETAGTWRTLSAAEGWYLLNERTNASRLRALVTLEDVHVDGLVILPDDSDATASQVTTTNLVASSGAVFLPCSGFRSPWGGGDLIGVGQIGNSWLSTPQSGYEGSAFFIYFEDGDVGMNSGNVSDGHPVRLVRDVK